MKPFYYMDDDYPARPEILSELPLSEWSNRCSSELSLGSLQYWCYALLL